MLFESDELRTLVFLLAAQSIAVRACGEDLTAFAEALAGLTGGLVCQRALRCRKSIVRYRCDLLTGGEVLLAHAARLAGTGVGGGLVGGGLCVGLVAVERGGFVFLGRHFGAGAFVSCEAGLHTWVKAAAVFGIAHALPTGGKALLHGLRHQRCGFTL